MATATGPGPVLTPMLTPVLTPVWDWPVRLVHWGFVALLPALWWSAESGRIDLHQTLGLTMLGLVVFRLMWGLIGSSTARFGGFVRGPAAILRYVRGMKSADNAPIVGHNPLGGWSVITLLTLLTAQAGLGLVTQDTDGIEFGPLNHLVSYDTAEAARAAHEIGFNLILAFAALHIAAVLWYRLVRKDDLVRPMLTGHRRFTAAVTPARFAPWWRAVLCGALAAALAWWISLGAPRPGQAPPAQMNASDYM